MIYRTKTVNESLKIIVEQYQVATIPHRTRINLINKSLMMIFNRKKRTDQEMERILLLDHIQYQIPCPKAPCVQTPTSIHDYYRVVVEGNIRSIKKEDPVTK